MVSPRDAASGLPTGHVRHDGFEVTRPIDPLTPPFFNTVVNSTNAPSAKLELLAAVEGGKPQVYMTYQFTNAWVSSWRNEAGETLGIRYESVSIKPAGGPFPSRPASEVVGQMSVAGGAPVPIVGIKSEVVAPFDAASGLQSGKRQHKPFVVRRAIDGLTPSLFEKAIANTTTNEVKVELVQPGAATPYATYILRNATIASDRHSGAGGSAPVEEIEFAFESIELKHGGASATDNWSTPNA